MGRHDVAYRGFREGKGIWGTWEINTLAHGGFQIWPKRHGEGEAETESNQESEPVSAGDEVELRHAPIAHK